MNSRAVIVVRGLVQGVGYRYYIHRCASGLGLAGYAENLPGGEVKIVAEGDRGMIEELVTAARVGPRAAHVTAVSVEWEKPTHEFRGFSIR
ncbi:MAG: acylphosphatase [Ignavibacterium sp.]|jgi:acylphosphatase